MKKAKGVEVRRTAACEFRDITERSTRRKKENGEPIDGMELLPL